MKKYTDEECIAVTVSYFRDALIELGRHSIQSNVKHNGVDAPIEWTRNIANDHEGGLKRHLGIPEDTDLSHMLEIDKESGRPHSVSSAWRNLALNQIRLEEQANDKNIWNNK